MALALCALSCVASLAIPPVLLGGGVMSLSAPLRAFVVAVAAALVASPMGLPFPALIRAASRVGTGGAPWLYGINATTSVGAAALHAAIAPAIGLQGTTGLAALCYAVGTAIAVVGRKR